MKPGHNFSVSFGKDHKIQIVRFLRNALICKQTSKSKGHLNCVGFCHIVKPFQKKNGKVNSLKEVKGYFWPKLLEEKVMFSLIKLQEMFSPVPSVRNKNGETELNCSMKNL